MTRHRPQDEDRADREDGRPSVRLVEDSDEDFGSDQIPDAELEEEDPDEPTASGLTAEEAAMHLIEGE